MRKTRRNVNEVTARLDKSNGCYLRGRIPKRNKTNGITAKYCSRWWDVKLHFYQLNTNCSSQIHLHVLNKSRRVIPMINGMYEAPSSWCMAMYSARSISTSCGDTIHAELEWWTPDWMCRSADIWAATFQGESQLSKIASEMLSFIYLLSSQTHHTR